jgi:hypothetical protein
MCTFDQIFRSIGQETKKLCHIERLKYRIKVLKSTYETIRKYRLENNWKGTRNSRWYQCSLHLYDYDIPTSHGANNATGGDESVELNLTIFTNSGLCLLS